MTGSIICGVDDSESAKGAARVARRLGAQLRLRIVFVRVAERGAPAQTVSAIAERLHLLAAEATDADCGAHWLVEYGHPADRLVATAKEQDAALIVVGSSGPRSSSLGSISADVSRRAPCPVVVVAPGADASVTNGRAERKIDVRTSFPGLFDDGYTGDDGHAAPSDFAGAAEDAAPSGGGRDANDFAGGIVRFNLGGSEK